MTSPFVSDIPAEQARRAWREACAAAGCPPRVDAVLLPVGEAVGRVTAESVWARRSSPAFDSAAMDGIAVRAAETVGAAETTPVLLDDFAVVDTGDPLPAGYDAVVMREHVHHTPDGRAELRAAVPPYQHVRSIGEDISATELLLPEGHRLRPVDVAACAAAGVVELAVRRRPRVVIIPTGDEIRPVGTELAPGEIADTNSMMLAAQAAEIGCETRTTGIVADDPELITAAVREAAVDADLVILIAGSSAGRDDYTARVVAAAGSLAVHGVAVRPGHPVVLGTVAGEPATPMPATPILGAPGYPVSAALTFDIFAAPMLAALEGAAPRERPATTARLARKLASAIGSDDWVRVRLGRVGGDIVATPLPRAAGVLTSLVRADGLLVVPAGVEGHHAGERVRVELLRGLADIERTIVAIGSHDLVLDVAASALRAADPLLTLASSNVGSLGGLVALRDGLCHLAGSHLLDPATGEYTLPYLDRIFGPDARAGRGPAGAPRPGSSGRPRQPAGADRHRRPHPTRPALRQPPARRRHPGTARPRAGPAGRRPGRHHRLLPRGAHPPRGGRRRRRRPRRHRPGHPGRCPGVRAGLRPGRPRALRPRAARRRRWRTPCSPRCGRCWSSPTSVPRWRSSAATRAPRPADGSAESQSAESTLRP